MGGVWIFSGTTQYKFSIVCYNVKSNGKKGYELREAQFSVVYQREDCSFACNHCMQHLLVMLLAGPAKIVYNFHCGTLTVDMTCRRFFKNVLKCYKSFKGVMYICCKFVIGMIKKEQSNCHICVVSG